MTAPPKATPEASLGSEHEREAVGGYTSGTLEIITAAC